MKKNQVGLTSSSYINLTMKFIVSAWVLILPSNPAIFSFPPSSKKLTQADKKP